MVVCDVFDKYNIYNSTQANPGPKILAHGSKDYRGAITSQAGWSVDCPKGVWLHIATYIPWEKYS